MLMSRTNQKRKGGASKLLLALAAITILAPTVRPSTAGDKNRGQPAGADETSATETPAPGKQGHAGDDEGVTAGWDGGFYVRSAEGNFEFRPLAILHVDFRGHDDARQFNTDETLATTFDIRRLRLGFEGFLFKDIHYSLEVNFDEDETELIYAYLDFGHIPSARLRIGQFKEPFSYEVLYPEKYLDFIERANIVSAVGPAESIGAMVHNFGRPLGGKFEYGLGVFNGNGVHLNDEENNDMEVAARLALLPFAGGLEWLQKLRLAGNVTYVREQERGFGFRARTAEKFEFFPRLAVEGSRMRVGGDLQWFSGPVSLKGEYIRAEEERPGVLRDLITDGWHVDATWLVTGEEKQRSMKRGWELVARSEEIRVDAQEPFVIPDFVDESANPISIEDNLVRTLTLGVNRYVFYNMKFQLNYQHDRFDSEFLTPTSRRGSGVLASEDRSWSKVLARVQLFF
jgi:phosphate-selective porin OprO/OprP